MNEAIVGRPNFIAARDWGIDFDRWATAAKATILRITSLAPGAGADACYVDRVADSFGQSDDRAVAFAARHDLLGLVIDAKARLEELFEEPVELVLTEAEGEKQILLVVSTRRDVEDVRDRVARFDVGFVDVIAETRGLLNLSVEFV
ncbi:MAG: hypothetical protein HYV07_23095 [Deltaproteobacteria bacterium]|nr:hypothetical protein [Deltaproteobacteria bacterium]